MNLTAKKELLHQITPYIKEKLYVSGTSPRLDVALQRYQPHSFYIAELSWAVYFEKDNDFEILIARPIHVGYEDFNELCVPNFTDRLLTLPKFDIPTIIYLCEFYTHTGKDLVNDNFFKQYNGKMQEGFEEFTDDGFGYLVNSYKVVELYKKAKGENTLNDIEISMIKKAGWLTHGINFIPNELIETVEKCNYKGYTLKEILDELLIFKFSLPITLERNKRMIELLNKYCSN